MKGIGIVAVLSLYFIKTAVTLNFTVIHGIGNTDTFECNSLAILRCNADPSVGVQWIINGSTNSAAECYSPSCTIFENFGGRYSFSYDPNTGYSNLTFNTSNFLDDRVEYICDDFSDSKIFRASVKLFPKTATTQIYSQNSTVYVRTGCTIQAGNVTFTWFKKQVNGGTESNISESKPVEMTENCACATNCEGTCWSGSFNVSSLKAEKSVEQFTIGCIIESSDSDSPGPIKISSSSIFNATDSTSTTSSSTTSSTASTITFTAVKPTSSKTTTTTTTTTPNHTIVIIAVTSSIGGVILVVSVIVVVIRRCSKRKKENERQMEQFSDLNVKKPAS